MRRRTRAPSRNSATPRRYLPVLRSCSSMPSATSVTASRCAVLLAIASLRARSLIPISTSSSENALSSLIAVATEDSRSRRRASDLDRFAIGRGLVACGPCGLSRDAGIWTRSTLRKTRSTAFRNADQRSNLGAVAPSCQSRSPPPGKLLRNEFRRPHEQCPQDRRRRLRTGSRRRRDGGPQSGQVGRGPDAQRRALRALREAAAVEGGADRQGDAA